MNIKKEWRIEKQEVVKMGQCSKCGGYDPEVDECDCWNGSEEVKNFGTIIYAEYGNVNYINTTPHIITFQTETGELVELPPCGRLVNATPTEEIVKKEDGIYFVTTKFVADEETEEFLYALDRMFNVGNETLVVAGSLIAAQAYPGRVVALTPVKGFERVPPAEKRMNLDKFTVFQNR